MDVSRYHHWTGNGEDLAELAGDLLALNAKTKNQARPNLRVLRDYVQRKIVSPPEHQGREAIYSCRHLVQFLAARVLVADNWPLRKIAEMLPRMGEDKLTALIGSGMSDKSTRPSRKSGNGDTELGRTFGMVEAISPIHPHQKDEQGAIHDRLLKQFGKDAERVIQKQTDLAVFRGEMAIEGDLPNPEGWLRFKLLPWFEFWIDSNEAVTLTFNEADLIGKGVTAALYDFMTRESR